MASTDDDVPSIVKVEEEAITEVTLTRRDHDTITLVRGEDDRWAFGGDTSAAADVLREAGHAVHLNGHGLCVAVPRDRKAEPVAALARRQIEVRDIEVLQDVQIPEASR